MWMASAGNAPLWRELQGLGLLQARGGVLLGVTVAGMLVALLFALLSLFSWRGVLKPALVLLLFATALGAHFMWTYHIVIDSSMATNTLQTDWHEARALLTPRLALVVLLGAVLPAWLVWLFVHIMYLIQFQSRILVFVQWGFLYLTFSRGARLITGSGEAEGGRGNQAS